MLNKRNVKKVTKDFSHFTEEEKWLHSMLNDGWVLTRYSSEELDDCQYVFEPVKNEEQRNLIYKIDYREFNKKVEFEEYKDIFEDAGWTILSKSKGYSKHIFFSEATNTHRDIFSDHESYQERERRKMSSSLTTAITSFSVFIVFIILYIYSERTAFMGASLFVLSTSIKFIVDYFKHRKVYQSFVNNEVR